MNRRHLLMAIGGLTGLGVFHAYSARPVKTYGRVTVASERTHHLITGEHLHVYVYGVDVTYQCYECDDEQGYALVFCEDPEHHKPRVRGGKIHLTADRSDACRHRLTGHVVIAPGPARL